MSSIVRTIHTTHPLLKISKMVAVLLLIFFPAIALANPIFQSSSNSNTYPGSIRSEQSYRAEPVSYEMTHTATYQIGTTYNPAQTVYEPFSNENPSSDNSLGTIGGETASQEERKDRFITPSDPGEPTPLGDAWSLLIFAAMAAVVITLRKKQTA